MRREGRMVKSRREITGPGIYGGDCQGHLSPRRARRSPNLICFLQANVEELLYIVNFENEAGYAILGADDRLEPVYAVVDEGSHNGYYYVGAFNTAKSPVTLGVSSTGPGDFSNDNEIMMYML